MKNQSKSMLISCHWLLWLLLVCVTLQSSLTNGTDHQEDADDYSYIIGSDKEPSKWGGLRPEWKACKTGKLQSPIDIPVTNDPPLPSIGQLTRNYKPANANLTKHHTVKFWWQPGEAGSILLDGRATYNLESVHWHTPSENLLNGKRFNLEVHMAHTNADPTAANKITVISHFYQTGPPDLFLCTVMGNVAKQGKKEQTVSVDPKLIVGNGTEYFRFIGSLTTPPCTENVIWIVDQTVSTVSEEQIQILKDASRAEGEGNARPLQPLHNRSILHGSFLQT